MSDPEVPSTLTRRSLLTLGIGLAATACSAPASDATVAPAPAGQPLRASAVAAAAPTASVLPEPFYGPHQAGILTPAPAHCCLAALDVLAAGRDAIVALLRRWTEACARMTQGAPAVAEGDDAQPPGADSGECRDLPHAQLTVTMGVGPSFFLHEGRDRFGLAARCPVGLAPLPAFPGDRLDLARSGGDLVFQACAQDPQVAFHAIRQLVRLGEGAVRVRWLQRGFLGLGQPNVTPRNLLGFKDGSANLDTRDGPLMDRHVWVGAQDAPAWMTGGSYLVIRRIRLDLGLWDRMPIREQERTFGRRKGSGAPLTGLLEQAPLDLDGTDEAGNLIIDAQAHVRLGHHTTNDGARILRRSYSYVDGPDPSGTTHAPGAAPPGSSLPFEAGLLFLCYQRDIRTGFTPIFTRMAAADLLNRVATSVGSAVFACPRGVQPGGFLGEDLFT